jgi:hypothetical protein
VRAVTLAETAGQWLDGDAHQGTGPGPEKRLNDLQASLEKVLQNSDYPAVVRTLRPKADAKAVIASRPSTFRPAALEVVIVTGEGTSRRDVDYRPEMEEALFEKGSTSQVTASQVWAYAPVFDSWGSTPAIVWVSGPSTAPLWRRLAFGIGAILFSGILVCLAVWVAGRAGERLEGIVAKLDEGVRELASGRMPSPFALPRDTPSELATLAGSLETLRARLEAAATGQPLPPPPATEAQAERAAQLGEPSEFDLALLLQQLLEPARKSAHARRVEVQLVFPDGVPSHLRGHPMPLFRALDSMLRNAVRTTKRGSITLRVSRVGASPEGDQLRFEVADTSPGIAFKEQQELAAALAAAAQVDPGSLKDPLQLASALASSLGGELAFESQPGQGSRFGFTASFQRTGPAPATGFHPQAATDFQPRPATAFQPRPALPAQPELPPESAFVPRSKIGSR